MKHIIYIYIWFHCLVRDNKRFIKTHMKISSAKGVAYCHIAQKPRSCTRKKTSSISALFQIQSGAFISWSNIERYYINNGRNWVRISIRCWMNKMHPIPRPNGRAMGWLLWGLRRKLTALWRHRTVLIFVAASWRQSCILPRNGPLAKYVKLQVRMRRECRERFPWHASRHVRHARNVMHTGIANSRFPLNSAAGGNAPGFPGACATRNFTHLVRGPWTVPWWLLRWHGVLRTRHTHHMEVDDTSSW